MLSELRCERQQIRGSHLVLQAASVSEYHLGIEYDRRAKLANLTSGTPQGLTRVTLVQSSH